MFSPKTYTQSRNSTVELYWIIATIVVLVIRLDDKPCF